MRPPKRLLRVSSGLADQAVCSLVNLGVQLAMAHQTSGANFGLFGILFVFMTLAISMNRAAGVEPLTVTYSIDKSQDEVRRSLSAVTGLALLIGVSCTSLLLLWSPWLESNPSQHAILLAFCLAAPPLLLQDTWRFLYICHSRTHRALVNDLIGLALFLVSGMAATRSGACGAAVVLCWGGAAAIASLLPFISERVWPNPVAGIRFLVAHRLLSARYLTETLAMTGSQQVFVFLVTALAGLTAAGQIRLAQVVMGPVNVLLQGIGGVALPMAVAERRNGPRELRRFVFLMGLALAVVSLTWLMVVLLLPQSLLTSLVGHLWPQAAPLLVPVGVAIVAAAITNAPFVGLRAAMALNSTLTVRLVTSTVNACAGLGAFAGGALGAASALALAMGFEAVTWCLVFAHRTTQKHWKVG